MSIPSLDRAVEVAGSQSALAKSLGIKSPSISGWYERGKVPVERCAAIEAATGVSRHDLRPDVFGPAPTNDEPTTQPEAAHGFGPAPAQQGCAA